MTDQPFTPDLGPISTLGAYTATVETKSKPVPSAEDLRGIPVVGRGVGGAQPGSQPEAATIRKLDRQAA